MPTIKPSSILINNYNEISNYCHRYSKPVFITKNGVRDLAVMSIETYQKITGRCELYKLIDEGMEDLKNDKTLSAKEAFKKTKKGN